MKLLRFIPIKECIWRLFPRIALLFLCCSLWFLGMTFFPSQTRSSPNFRYMAAKSSNNSISLIKSWPLLFFRWQNLRKALTALNTRPDLSLRLISGKAKEEWVLKKLWMSWSEPKVPCCNLFLAELMASSINSYYLNGIGWFSLYNSIQEI